MTGKNKKQSGLSYLTVSSMRDAIPCRRARLKTQTLLIPHRAGSGMVEQHQALWRSMKSSFVMSLLWSGCSRTLYAWEKTEYLHLGGGGEYLKIRFSSCNKPNADLSDGFSDETSYHQPFCVDEQECFSLSWSAQSHLLEAQLVVRYATHFLGLKSKQESAPKHLIFTIHA